MPLRRVTHQASEEASEKAGPVTAIAPVFPTYYSQVIGKLASQPQVLGITHSTEGVGTPLSKKEKKDRVHSPSFLLGSKMYNEMNPDNRAKLSST